MIDRRALLGLAAALALPATAARAADEIAYGEGPDRRLDVHGRPGLGAAPVLVYIHGGGWRRGDKRMVHDLPAYAQRHGLLLVSVNYRMVPQVDAGGCAEDAAAALAWVRANISRYGGDPGRIFVSGHSAGAHLAALIAIDRQYLGAHGVDPEALAGIITIDGAGYDAVAQMAWLEDRQVLLSSMYQNAFGARAAELSPTLLVKGGEAYPPFLIFHVASRPDAERQSNGLAEALRAAGGRAEVIAAPGDSHRSINVEFGAAGDPEGERAAVFIRG